MKTYKVLEAHQGDRFYAPGDPQTGTRIADPNAVSHLVALGLLEEVGDAPDDATVTSTEDANNTLLADQIATLTRERDEARVELGTVRDDLTATRAAMSTLVTERDEARATVAQHETTQQGHADRVQELEREVASLKAAAAKQATRGRGAN